MKVNEIRNRIAEGATLFGFRYKGKTGNVDPYYIPEDKSSKYLLFFDDSEQTVHDIDSVMNTPFIDGKSLNDVAEQLIITEW